MTWFCLLCAKITKCQFKKEEIFQNFISNKEIYTSQITFVLQCAMLQIWIWNNQAKICLHRKYIIFKKQKMCKLIISNCSLCKDSKTKYMF